MNYDGQRDRHSCCPTLTTPCRPVCHSPVRLIVLEGRLINLLVQRAAIVHFWRHICIWSRRLDAADKQGTLLFSITKIKEMYTYVLYITGDLGSYVETHIHQRSHDQNCWRKNKQFLSDSVSLVSQSKICEGKTTVDSL